MDRGWDAAFAADECLAAVAVDWHYRSVSEQTSELYTVSDFLAFYRNDTYCGGLLVDHSDSCFICYDT